MTPHEELFALAEKLTKSAGGADSEEVAKPIGALEEAAHGLPLGALDDDPGVKPKFHVFVANKAPWFDITDELPQFPALPKKAP